MTLCARPSGSDGVFISVKMVLQGYSEAVIYWCEKSSLKTAIQLLNLYSEAVIYRCKSDENTPLSGGSYKKTRWKRTLRRWFYRYKTYENILKFNLWCPPLSHIDCLREQWFIDIRHGDLQIQWKNSVPWILWSRHFIDAKPIKHCINSCPTSTVFSIIYLCVVWYCLCNQ